MAPFTTWAIDFYFELYVVHTEKRRIFGLTKRGRKG